MEFPCRPKRASQAHSCALRRPRRWKNTGLQRAGPGAPAMLPGWCNGAPSVSLSQATFVVYSVDSLSLGLNRSPGRQASTRLLCFCCHTWTSFSGLSYPCWRERDRERVNFGSERSRSSRRVHKIDGEHPEGLPCVGLRWLQWLRWRRWYVGIAGD